MRRSSLLAAGLVLLVLAPLPATARAERSGRCLPAHASPRCRLWSGRVTFIADGDTVDVAIRGVGTRRVRLGGINATELTRYSKYRDRRRGECHARPAAARLEQLLRRARWRVRLAAQDEASVSGTRLRRALYVRSAGRWVDVAGTLVREGHALWLPSHVEWAWNRGYAAAARRAAAARLRLWDPAGCGPGPSATVAPGLRVNWDADGNDFANVDGEYLRIANPTPLPLPLGGWWVRDSSARRFRLPVAASVPPRGSLDVHVGRGRATPADLYWGLGVPVFENATGAPRHEGDGGYLFDPRGNLRASAQYGG